jgi:hypothetical protein
MDIGKFFKAATKPVAMKPATTKLAATPAREPVLEKRKGSEPLEPACILGVELPPGLNGGALSGSALAAFQLLDTVDTVPPPPDPADIAKAYKARFPPSPARTQEREHSVSGLS